MHSRCEIIGSGHTLLWQERWEGKDSQAVIAESVPTRKTPSGVALSRKGQMHANLDVVQRQKIYGASWKNYIPLLVVVAVTLLSASAKQAAYGGWSWMTWVQDFMGLARSASAVRVSRTRSQRRLHGCDVACSALRIYLTRRCWHGADGDSDAAGLKRASIETHGCTIWRQATRELQQIEEITT